MRRDAVLPLSVFGWEKCRIYMCTHSDKQPLVKYSARSRVHAHTHTHTGVSRLGSWRILKRSFA